VTCWGRGEQDKEGQREGQPELHRFCPTLRWVTWQATSGIGSFGLNGYVSTYNYNALDKLTQSVQSTQTRTLGYTREARRCSTRSRWLPD
jgi:hypothetical protein